MQNIKDILQKVSEKKLKVDEALDKLKFLPYEDLGFVKIDHHRSLRKGFPEAVYCEGKTPEQVLEIMKKLSEINDVVIGSRASKETFDFVKKEIKDAKYNGLARIISIIKKNPEKKGKIIVMCAGTSDIRVAEEAAIVAESMGNNVERLYDVGVAGLHRLLDNKEKIEAANAIVVVAGMEGALPSVVSGLTSRPIIAVPTSVGYGASFNGIAPLLAMLNSCSPGITVVNIDNGFGAGYFASLINK